MTPHPNIPARLVKTRPFDGQKPGTSGLRKKVFGLDFLGVTVAAICCRQIILLNNARPRNRRVNVPQVTEFEQDHYLENFVQSTFNALPAAELKGELELSIDMNKSIALMRDAASLPWQDRRSSCLGMGGITRQLPFKRSSAWQRLTPLGSCGSVREVSCPRRRCLLSSATEMEGRRTVASSSRQATTPGVRTKISASSESA